MVWKKCAVAVLVLLMGSSVLADEDDASVLAGSEWRPVQLLDLQLDADAEAFIQFGGDGKVTGHGGCNRFFGSFERDGSTLSIGQLARTLMACPEPLMELEGAMMNVLGAARSYKRDRVDLVLFDEDGQEIGVFVQTDAD